MTPWKELSPKGRRKRLRAIRRQGILALGACLVLAGAGWGGWSLWRHFFPGEPDAPAGEIEVLPEIVSPEAPEAPEEPEMPAEPELPRGPAVLTEETVTLDGQLGSRWGILVDADAGVVLAEKGCDEKIYPASMTKVLTLLVAAENIPDPQETFVMTQEIIDPLYRRGATITGIRAGESVTLETLFYGAALRSAADATQALAIAAAGSVENFLTLMNDKAAALGLSELARFTNTSGLFDEEHACTLRDMAAIMAAAMDNELCARVLSTAEYTSEGTASAPEGLVFENTLLTWFLEKQPETAVVSACKSGYVVQAGNCLVSWGKDENGRTLVCATAGASRGAVAIRDHRLLYDQYSGNRQEE